MAKHFGDVVLQLPREDFSSNHDQLSVTTLDRGDSVEILSSDVNETIHQLVALKIPLARLQIRQRTLEDLFLELTGKELRV